MTRRDRAAMQLALECVRHGFAFPRMTLGHVHSALVLGDFGGQAHAIGDAALRAERVVPSLRLLRARLALLLRAMLRADRGDFGRIECTGCGDDGAFYHRPGDGCRECWLEHWQETGEIVSDRVRPKYEIVRITPLWERARPHGGKP